MATSDPRLATQAQWEDLTSRVKDSMTRLQFIGANIVPSGGDIPSAWIAQYKAGTYVIDYYGDTPALTDQPDVAGILVAYHTGNASTDGKVYHYFIAHDGSLYMRVGSNRESTWTLDWFHAPKIPSNSIGTAQLIDGSVTASKVKRPYRENWYASIPTIGNDGVMEVGKYLDFHDTGDGDTDYDTRILSYNGNLFIGNASTSGNRVAKMSDVTSAYTAGDNVSITNGVISATNTTYTAGTGISITNGAISKTKYNLIDIIEGQGVDPTVTDSSSVLTPSVITEQQHDAIAEFILAHKNDSTVYVDYQYVQEEVVVFSCSADQMSVTQDSFTFTEDRGFDIGNVDFLTSAYLFGPLDGSGIGRIMLCHNTDTGIYYFLHTISG